MIPFDPRVREHVPETSFARIPFTYVAPCPSCGHPCEWTPRAEPLGCPCTPEEGAA